MLNGRRHIWELCEGFGTSADTKMRYGVPRKYKNYQDWTNFLLNVGVMGNDKVTGIESTIYTDIRPRTQDKKGNLLPNDEIRVEFRPCDMMPTLAENMALTSFLKCFILASLDKNNFSISDGQEEIDKLCRYAQMYRLDFNLTDGLLFEQNLTNMLNVLRDYCPSDEIKYFENLLQIINREGRAEQHRRMGSISYIEDIIKNFEKEILWYKNLPEGFSYINGVVYSPRGTC